jgi:hypothetical protein
MMFGCSNNHKTVSSALGGILDHSLEAEYQIQATFDVNFGDFPVFPMFVFESFWNS